MDARARLEQVEPNWSGDCVRDGKALDVPEDVATNLTILPGRVAYTEMVCGPMLLATEPVANDQSWMHPRHEYMRVVFRMPTATRVTVWGETWMDMQKMAMWLRDGRTGNRDMPVPTDGTQDGCFYTVYARTK